MPKDVAGQGDPYRLHSPTQQRLTHVDDDWQQADYVQSGSQSMGARDGTPRLNVCKQKVRRTDRSRGYKPARVNNRIHPM